VAQPPSAVRLPASIVFLRALCGLFFLSRRELTRMRAPISIWVYQRESVASVHGGGEQKLHRAASVTQGDEIHGGTSVRTASTRLAHTQTTNRSFSPSLLSFHGMRCF